MCLDCGDSVAVEVADGDFVKIEPAEIVGYVCGPVEEMDGRLGAHLKHYESLPVGRACKELVSI